jgi:hypothetical protein
MSRFELGREGDGEGDHLGVQEIGEQAPEIGVVSGNRVRLVVGNAAATMPDRLDAEEDQVGGPGQPYGREGDRHGGEERGEPGSGHGHVRADRDRIAARPETRLFSP